MMTISKLSFLVAQILVWGTVGWFHFFPPTLAPELANQIIVAMLVGYAIISLLEYLRALVEHFRARVY